MATADEGAVLDDRYELGALLGRGGSAAVHRAWDRERGREVAVKLLPPGEGRPGRSESDILAMLDHPHLVALHDVLTTEEGVALVMELVDGPSLQERLEHGALPAEEALVVLRDVAAGLAHAHRRGVVHRDVKPGNVLLRLDAGRVVTAKLSDFGIARRSEATRTTGERRIVGTLRYLSPEQARGARATAASDVYSLGLTLLVALTGEEAFPGRETESLAGRMLRAPAIPEGLPEDWTDLLRGMTALDPDDRFDASAVAALACSLGSATRIAAPVHAVVRQPAETQRIDVARRATFARPRRTRMAARVAGVAVAGALLGGLIAVALAPASVQQATSGAAQAPSGTGAATTTRSTTATGSSPSDDRPTDDRRTDDRDSGGHGSGGHGQDD